ncbi:MAG: S41 family peptidase [Alphaproteobacteria bacterium]|nr:S41 family peptidase [Alphaproteobacteria bacterium]
MRKWALTVAAVALLAPGAALPQAKSGDTGIYEQLNLFGEAFERIRHDAVEPVGDNKLVETAITGMLTSLDPHSEYLTEDAYKAMQNKAPNQGASTGLVATSDGGQFKVVSPLDGSSAASAGIKPGDSIFSIDKQPTFDMTLSEVEQKLRGPAGSEVALVLRRSGTSGPIDVKLKRSDDKTQSVASHLEGGDVGYLRIADFDDTTANAISNAVKDLRQQSGGKMIGLVVDLRNNPGGNFDAAVASADDFIDKGDIAVVKSRKADAKKIAATPGDIANGQPIVALVNGGTAREAELMAGAMQDNRRAVLLGGKTFGESGIETIIPVPGNGAIRLTTARYQTPSGRTIQGKGLEPDLTVSPLKLEKVTQADRLREADLRGALKNPDAVPPAPNAAPKDPTPPKQADVTATPPKGDQPTVATEDIGTPSDEQLSEAIDVLRGLGLASGRTASR